MGTGKTLLIKKWEAFGWNVIKVDGHDYRSIIEGLNKAKNARGNHQ